MEKWYYLVFLVLGFINPILAQGDMNGVFEYEITNIYKSEEQRQDIIRKTKKVSEMIGGDGKLIRQIESKGFYVSYFVKEDSLLSVLTLFEDSLPHSMNVQMNFWAWTVNVDSKEGNLLSEDAVEQLFEKSLQGNWRDEIHVSSFFNTDYKSAIRHKKEKMTILGYECTMYELPEKTGTAVNYFWIAESLKPSKKQQLPYFFDSIFTPYGIIFKKTQVHSLGESTRIIKKLELKTAESFAKELSTLNLKLE